MASIPVSDGTKISIGMAGWVMITTALTLFFTTDSHNINLAILLLFTGVGCLMAQNFTRLSRQDNPRKTEKKDSRNSEVE